MFDRLRSLVRGGDLLEAVAEPSPRVDAFHYVSPYSLEQLRVATELQGGAAAQYLLAQTAVYRGVQIITDLVSSVPWFALSGGDPSHSQLLEVRPPEPLEFQPRLLLRPNPFESRDRFVRKFVESLIWHGNVYVRGALFVDGRPTAVQVLDPNEVVVTPLESERTRAKYTWRNLELSLGVDLWHEQLVTVPGSLVGVSPLTAGMPVVAGNIAADRYSRQMFEGDLAPKGVLEAPGMLDKNEAADLLEQWEEGGASRSTRVLSGGLSWSQVSLTPEQAQFLHSRSYGTQEVARLLGIPQWLVNAGSPPGSGSSLTYTNVQAVFIELVRTTLDPTYFRRIESVFSALLPRGQTVRFDTDELTRSDREGRFRAWDSALGGQPFMTVDEVRRREGLPPDTEVRDARAVQSDTANR